MSYKSYKLYADRKVDRDETFLGDSNKWKVQRTIPVINLLPTGAVTSVIYKIIQTIKKPTGNFPAGSQFYIFGCREILTLFHMITICMFILSANQV